MSALSLIPTVEFFEEEEHTGIHVRPTLSNDTEVIAISSTIAALLAESEAEEKIEDLSASAEEERGETIVAQASLPPAPEESFARPAPSLAREGRRFAGLALAIVATGFAAGFFFTRSPEVSAPRNEATDVVAIPKVTIAPAAVAVAPTAPVETAEPAPAAKPPPTLADATWMLDHNELTRAEQIYQSLLASGGSDHEALTGLGKVALRRGQDSDAIAFFERALARQPQYFPARLGVADALWNSGKKDSAKARYAALRERYADNMIPARVVERTK